MPSPSPSSLFTRTFRDKCWSLRATDIDISLRNGGGRQRPMMIDPLCLLLCDTIKRIGHASDNIIPLDRRIRSPIILLHSISSLCLRVPLIIIIIIEVIVSNAPPPQIAVILEMDIERNGQRIEYDIINRPRTIETEKRQIGPKLGLLLLIGLRY